MTIVITEENRHQYTEALFNPQQKKDPGQRWTQARRADMEQFIAQNNGARPVTILNLNTHSLKINGGVFFPDSIPGCPLGQPYTIFQITKTRWGHRDLGCDAEGMMQMEPFAAIPMVQAAEYIREYSQHSDGSGGVICYLGEEDPATFDKKTIITVPEIAFNAQGTMYIELKQRNFFEALELVKSRRNAKIMKRMQDANNWHEVEAHRINIDDTYRDDARLALQEGLIAELPSWCLHANTSMHKTVDPCPACQKIPLAGAILCVNCGQIFNVLEAFRNGRVAYTGVEMERLDAEGWKEANKIQAERQKAKGAKTQ